jgi:hypothetical protein
VPKEIGADHADRHAVETHFPAERALGQPLEEDDHRQVVLQVFSDRQIGDRIDAHVAQMRGGPDAGEHEEVRGIEGAAGEDHLAARLRARHVAAGPDVFDAGGAGALGEHARRMRAGLDREISPLPGRLEERGGGRRAVAVADGVLPRPRPSCCRPL